MSSFEAARQKATQRAASLKSIERRIAHALENQRKAEQRLVELQVERANLMAGKVEP